MMHVLVRDGLVDDEWVDAHTVGYDELVAHVADWTPARAGGDLRRRRRRHRAAGRRCTARSGRPPSARLIGAEHHENGAMFYRTLACLPALVGAWRDRGGGLSRSVGLVRTTSSSTSTPSSRPDLLAGPVAALAQHEPAGRGRSPTRRSIRRSTR